MTACLKQWRLVPHTTSRSDLPIDLPARPEPCNYTHALPRFNHCVGLGSSVAITKATRSHGPMCELWLMDTNGDDLRKLDGAGETDGFGFVQWSPDSNRLAYLRYVRKHEDFRVSMESRDLKGGPPITLLSDNALRSLTTCNGVSKETHLRAAIGSKVRAVFFR